MPKNYSGKFYLFNMKSMNKKLILILTIIALFGISLLFWNINKNQTGSEITIPENNQPIAIDTQTDETKKIDNWQTYINKDYGFEFQYPSDLEKKENQYYFFDLVNNRVAIHVDILDEKFDIKNVKSPIGYVPQDTISETTINGIKAYYFSDGDMGVGGNSYRMPLNKNHTLLIWFVTEGGSYQDENQILSSIKILNK